MPAAVAGIFTGILSVTASGDSWCGVLGLRGQLSSRDGDLDLSPGRQVSKKGGKSTKEQSRQLTMERFEVGMCRNSNSSSSSLETASRGRKNVQKSCLFFVPTFKSLFGTSLDCSGLPLIDRPDLALKHGKP